MNANTTTTPVKDAGAVKTFRTSMCMSVRGAIRNLNRQSSRTSGFQHLDGRPMTRDEAIDALMDELSKGHEVMPMNSKCDKPCKNSELCAGFDYGKDGGCPGYPVEDGKL